MRNRGGLLLATWRGGNSCPQVRRKLVDVAERQAMRLECHRRARVFVQEHEALGLRQAIPRDDRAEPRRIVQPNLEILGRRDENLGELAVLLAHKAELKIAVMRKLVAVWLERRDDRGGRR